MRSNLPFSEGGFDLLPEKWQEQCLDLGGLLDIVDNSISSNAPIPLEQPKTDAFDSSRLPVTAPSNNTGMPPIVRKYSQSRKLAALLLQELDHAHVFLSRERDFLRADWLAIIALSKKYTTMSFKNGEDPYIRSKLKNALVHLYHERAAHVNFRMINHGIMIRVLQHHSNLMSPILSSENTSPSLASANTANVKNETNSVNGNTEQNVRSEDDLMTAFTTYLIAHPFFSQSLPQSSELIHDVNDKVVKPGSEDAVATAAASNDPLALKKESGGINTGLVSENEVALLYAELFCRGDVEVARAVLTYHAPSMTMASSARLSVMSQSAPLMLPSYSSEDLREYQPVNSDPNNSDNNNTSRDTYLNSLWSMMRGSKSSSLPSSPFGESDGEDSAVRHGSRGRGGVGQMARSAYENSKKASSRFCYGICGGWGSGDGLFGVLSSGGPFGLGLRLGIFLVLLVWVLWDCLVDDDMGKEVWHDPAFKVYRGLGNVVILLLCWGVDVLVWKRAGIDYERFLRLHPCSPGVDPSAAIFNIGLDLAIAFLLSLICFWKALRGVFLRGVPPAFAHIFPISLFFYIAYRALTPWKKRKFLYAAVYEVIVAPFGSTAFKEGFVGDVLTSTVRPLIDLSFSVLYFLGGVSGYYSSLEYLDFAEDRIEGTMFFTRIIVPSITVLPLWWRFCQNLQRSYDTRERWPHLGNAMKYATAATVALYGLFHKNAKNHIVWIFAFVFATLYQFWWDIFMDWDLVRIERTNKKPRRGMGMFSIFSDWSISFRRPLLYQRRGFYVAIAMANFVLRFFWTLTLIPEGGVEAWQNTIQVRLSPVLAGAEICRRCVWAFLRLENEHIHTYGTAIDDGFTYEEAVAIGTQQMEPMQLSEWNKRKPQSEGSNKLSSDMTDLDDAKSCHDDDDSLDETAPLNYKSTEETYQPVHVFGIPIVSSTASLSNNQVLTELTLLAAFVVSLGAFVAVGI